MNPGRQAAPVVITLVSSPPMTEGLQLFEYFAGRLSQTGVREWFRDWMNPAT
jgi:hypothetical protein